MTFTTGHGHFLLFFEKFYMSRATLYGDLSQFSITCMFEVYVTEYHMRWSTQVGAEHCQYNIG